MFSHVHIKLKIQVQYVDSEHMDLHFSSPVCSSLIVLSPLFVFRRRSLILTTYFSYLLPVWSKKNPVVIYILVLTLPPNGFWQ